MWRADNDRATPVRSLGENVEEVVLKQLLARWEYLPLRPLLLLLPLLVLLWLWGSRLLGRRNLGR